MGHRLRYSASAVVGVVCFLAVACSDPPPSPEPTPALSTVAAATVTPTRVPPTPVPSPTPELPPTAMVAPSPTPFPSPVATQVPTPLATPVRATPRPPPIVNPPQRGGTLNLASRGNIAHQDVHLDVSPALSTWGPGLVYSRLLRFRFGPQVELPSRAVECDLCESWKMESPTSYLFRLREGVQWQAIDPVGGRELTSEDVAYSYVRQSQPGLPNAPLLQNVDTVQPLAPLELRITLKSPDADILSLLADGHTKVVARQAVERAGDLRDGPTVGTGPWVLERTVPDDSHLFSRNPNYFEPRLPLLDGLRVHILPDATTRTAAFNVGIVDVHQMQPDEWVKYLQREPQAPSKLVKQPGIGLEVALNAGRPPFDDARIRQAVFLAMDPLRAIEEHWGGFAFVSMGSPVQGADWLPSAADIKRFLNRPLDARALFQDAGITEPVPVTIKVGDFGEAYLAHAESMAREMAAVGFAPEVQLVNRRDFGEKVWLGGDYQMSAGPTAPVAGPNGFLLPVLHSDGIWNTTGHRDKVLDALLETQAVSTDADLRSQAIREIRERVLLKAYRFMPAARVAIWTWRTRVRDFHPNFAGSEYYHWARVWLDS